MENRIGLVFDSRVTHAVGKAEEQAAQIMASALKGTRRSHLAQAKDTPKPNFLSELVKEHLAAGKHPCELFEEGGLLKQLTKQLVQICLEAEMDTPIGYEKGERAGKSSENLRNGNSKRRTNLTSANSVLPFRATEMQSSNHSWCQSTALDWPRSSLSKRVV